MKARITTVLSLVGVLGAGSAAALVNNQVLQNTESNSSGDVIVGTDSDDSTSGTTADSTTSESIQIQVNVLSATQTEYVIGDAGVVTLDTTGDVLTIVSATPNSGWAIVEAENYGPVDVEVKLQGGLDDSLVEFKANLLNGVVTTSVELKNSDSDEHSNDGSNDDGDDVAVTVAVTIDDDLDDDLDVDLDLDLDDDLDVDLDDSDDDSDSDSDDHDDD